MNRVQAPNGEIVEFPDGMPDAEISAVMRKHYGGPEAAAPDLPPMTQVKQPEAYRNQPASTLDKSAMGGLRRGTQAVGDGLANLAGLPVDAATAVLVNPAIGLKNWATGSETPLVREPFLGSENIKQHAVKPLIDAVGGYTNPDDMDFGRRAAYEGASAGTGALAGGLGLLRRGLTRAAEIAGKPSVAPKMADVITQPYVTAPAQSFARDTTMGLGSGFGLAGAKELPPEVRDAGGGIGGVISDLAASFGGGAGGLALKGAGSAAMRQGTNFLGNTMDRVVPGSGSALNWGTIDHSIPVAVGDDMRPYSKRTGDMAAEVYQGSATRPGMIANTLDENRADLQPVLGNRLPSPGAMAEDPGLVALEREMAMTDRNPTIRREQNFNAGLRDVVDGIAPEGDARQLQGLAQQEAASQKAQTQTRNDMQTEVVQREVDKAAGQQRGVEIAREREAAPLAPYQSEDAAVNASRKLDKALVDDTYIPDRTEKNRLYKEGTDPRTPVDMGDVAKAATQVEKTVGQLPESLQSGAANPALLGDLKETAQLPYDAAGKTRMAISEERNKARSAGEFGKADNLGEVQKPLNQALDAANPEAAANYKENFAPKYRVGEGDEMTKFTKEVDRDPTRSKTPPSETAGRFLSGPEKIASLRRVLDSSPVGEQGTAAVRDHLLSDLATSGVIDQRTGVIRPDRLRAWRDSYGSQLEQAAPGFGKEVDTMLAKAQKGEQLSGDLALEVKGSQKKLRDTERAAGRAERDTEDRINRGALGSVINADPDKAVHAIMRSPENAASKLKELADLTKNHPEAREGLKAAVRDYMIERGATTAVEKLPPGDSRGPLSPSGVRKLFTEHEKALAEIYTPEEMNSLRVVHKALDLQKTEQVRVTSGSPTAERLNGSFFDRARDTPMGQAAEAVVRVKYGMLKAGGMISTVSRYLKNFTPEDTTRATELLQRAAMDPDLARILATRDIPVGSPKYTSTIQKYLGTGAASRTAIEGDEEKPD